MRMPEPANSTPARLMSLAQCQAHMRADPLLGEKAPSLITLKRWSSSGLLKPAMHPRQPKRAGRLKPGAGQGDARQRHAYDLDRVIQITKEALADRFAAPAPTPVVPRAVGTVEPVEPSPAAAAAMPPAGGQPPGSVTTGGAAMQPAAHRAADQPELLGQILASMQDLAAAVKRHASLIEGGLADLAATRRMLMNKYDGERTAMSMRIDELSQRNALLEKSATSIDVPKLNSLLTRISDQLNQMAGASGPAAGNQERP